MKSINCKNCNTPMLEQAPVRCISNGFSLFWCPSCGTTFRNDMNNLTATGVQWMTPTSAQPPIVAASTLPPNLTAPIIGNGNCDIDALHAVSMGKVFKVACICKTVDEANAFCAKHPTTGVLCEEDGIIVIAHNDPLP